MMVLDPPSSLEISSDKRNIGELMYGNLGMKIGVFLTKVER